jgi:Phytanoyl-CoA dioxygenase (PhyH)
LIAEGDASSLWLRGALDSAALTDLDHIADSSGRPGGRVDWTRREIAAHLAPVTDFLRRQALPGAKLVRVVWFSKDATTNWGVPWHQDRIIAVNARHNVPGFRHWSKKSGVWHCEPPLQTFATMRFVRVHLDDCDAENGAMEIALGSESLGTVSEADAATAAATFPSMLCAARRGDIQVLPMLVLHRSRPSRTTTPRRALRIDFAAQDLPPPLSWYTA